MDGYNVIMQRLHQEAARGAAAAAAAEQAHLADERERLVDNTRDYALSLGCRAIVVFDAMGLQGKTGPVR